MALVGLMLVACGQQPPSIEPAIPYAAEIEKKVEETLGRMTLEEKIGQMTEMNVDLVGKLGAQPFEVDEALLDTVIGKYKVGSILNAPYTAAPTKEQWKVIIDAIQKKSMKTIGIPCIYGLDMNHGVTYTQDGTLFPQNINVAATFNRELARRGAEITAYETRASNTPWT